MKRKKGILYSSLLLVVLLPAFILGNKEHFDINVLKLEKRYIVKNEKGVRLDANIYRRWNRLLNIYDIVLLFENNEKYKECLFIDEHYKCIGMSVLGIPRMSYFHFFSPNLIQVGYEGYSYINLANKVKAGDITYSYFSDSVIEFNTFEEYKKYGEKIVIEKH